MADLPPFVRLDAADLTILFDLRRGLAELAYLGPRLAASEDLASICHARGRGPHESQPDAPTPATILPQADTGSPGTAAMKLHRLGAALHAELILTAVEQAEAVLTFRFTSAAGLALSIRWSISASGVITADTRLTNTGTEPVSIASLASLALPLPDWATQLTRFSGRWAGEMRGERLTLPHGIIGGVSQGGRPGFGGANWVLLEEPGAGETRGGAFAAHLAWSGDHAVWIERTAEGEAMLWMGARLEPGEIELEPGESFTAPDALFAVTGQGRAGLRGAFHRAAIEAMPRGAAEAPRKVHLNSWEALGFDLTLPKLKQLADDAATLGVERFVLDDGWFDGRRGDTASLGDWTPDPLLFPDGLGPLIDHVHARGMDFGLWVEPEMISPDSQLYRSHPDWCLHVPGAARPTQRHQLVLDLTRSEVSDHLFAALDQLLRDNAIAYLKWDHNRELLPVAGKGHAQTLALYALLDRVRGAHPDVEIETCASGGGRVDFEILRRCARYWASDNNDAIERLRINRSWFQFLPLAATGNHVGPSPNPITGRRLAMDFRAKVAMFGHLGVEADPAAMSAGERASLAAHISLYKQWRSVLHSGRLYEVESADPGVHGWLAWHEGRGLALAAQTDFAVDYNAPRVRLHGVPPDRRCRVRLVDPWPARAARYLADAEQWRNGFVLTGRALAEVGLAIPLTQPETAWLIAIESVQ